MARRRLEGLERVLGVNALFATAYGNVGSSVYYALGLVASYALGLTPVVFIITGIFFVFTAATYAEATTMYPEAGGSSSFARHAFNEFWSFFAAWAQLLTYVATIAISAFFVPHYLGGLFWPALRHSPGDIIFGCGVIVVLGGINIVGVRESTGVNIVLAVIDFLTQLLLVIIGIFLVLSPSILVDNVHFGVAPTWSNLLIALPIGMLAYTGIETVSNMSEEARDFASTVPAAISRVRIAVFAIYFTLPSVALSALPVYRTASGGYQTKLGVSEENGGFAGDPVLGVVKQLHLGVAQHVAETYVGLLAATILFLGTNAGLIGVSRLVYSMGSPPADARRPAQVAPTIPHSVDRNTRFLRVRDPRLSAGPGQFPWQRVLVRRAAVVDDRAPGGHTITLQAPRCRASLPRPGELARWRRRFAAVRDRRRVVHRDRVRRDRRTAPGRGRGRRRLAARRHTHVPVVSPPPWP